MEIKSQIILKQGIYYFDWTASGLAYKSIEEELLEILQTYSNTHSECSSNSKTTSQIYEFAREKLKQYLDLGDDFYLVGTGFGSTAAIKKFWEIMGVYIPPATKSMLFDDKTWQDVLKNAPLVITSPYEHHSNELHLRYAPCTLKRISLDENLGFNFTQLEQILKENSNKKIFLSISAASNVTGVKTNLKKVHQIVKSIVPSAIIAVDASSIIAHENLNKEYFDALFLSPHKLLGGVGSCGILAIRKNICPKNLPSFAGGGVVEYVSRTTAKFLDDFQKLEEAGTPPITELIRAYFAFKLRYEHGLDFIKQKEEELASYFENGLKNIKGIINYCPFHLQRVPIYAFNAHNMNCYDFAKILSQKYNIQARAGCSCAGPYGHDLLGLKDDFKPYFKPGWVRVSLHYSQDFSDIDYLLGAIKECV